MGLVRFVLLGAALVGGTALAADGERAPAPRLVVVGRASAEAAPDFAMITIGVSARAATAAAALDETSVAAAKVVAGARAFGGIEMKDVRTNQVSLQPMYKNVRDPGGGMRQQPDGYQASNSVVVRVRELPRLGEFMLRSVDEGATQLNGIVFGLTDRAKAERDAQAAAVADARAEAELLAGAAGVKLGRILEIRSVERGGDLRPSMTMGNMRAAVAPDVPTEPGQIEIAASVEVVWAIEQP